MAPRNNEAESNHAVGKHAASGSEQPSRRELRRAEKAAKKARKEADKAAKAAKRGGGVVAPVAAATPAEALGRSDLPQGAPTSADDAGGGASPSTVPATNPDFAEAPTPGSGPAEVPVSIPAPGVVEVSSSKAGEVPADSAVPGDVVPVEDVQAPADAYAFEEQMEAKVPGSYDDEYGFIPATPGNGVERYSRYSIGEDNQGYAAEVDANRRRRRRRKAVATVLVVLLCLVGVGSAGAYLYLNNLNQNLAGGNEQEAQEVKEVLTPAPIGDEPFYMLLVGCDDREGVEGARADTTILARLDPKNNQVTLLSIPRDTAIEIPEYGTQKFNAAYAFGGPSGTIRAASELCGVDISHYAEVHFEALIDIIDYIGGVDVDVPIPIDDVDAGGKLDAGYQHLNGEQAMIFARSRSYTNGDFQRTTSQRLLIEAAVQKVMQMSAAELPGLLMQVTRSLTSDMSVQELLGLALAFQDEPDLVMYSAIVPSSTAMIGDVSYVIADTYLLQQMMEVIDAGGDPATVVPDNYTVSTSEEAAEQGIEVIVNLGDEAPDEGAYGAYDYYSGYYGGGYYYYEDAGVYGYASDAYTAYDADTSYADSSYADTSYDDGAVYDDASGGAGYDDGYSPAYYGGGGYDGGYGEY